MSSTDPQRAAIEHLAERVGRDPLLIQGAGGNLSWKDGNVLWVKASGAWLAHARSEDMFVPVDLAGVRSMIDDGQDGYLDQRIGDSKLRPSIETALHALMPQRIVAHLHAVDAIAHVVVSDGEALLEQRLEGIAWMWIPYHKPGAALATAIRTRMRETDRVPDVLMLANHGIVFCADDVSDVEALYRDVLARLRIEPRPCAVDAVHESPLSGYVERRGTTRSLAYDAISLDVVRHHWVIYPDHAVFLGPEARIFDSLDEARSAPAADDDSTRSRRPCVIVPGIGVWLPVATSGAASDMLDCYAHVCLRLSDFQKVTSLDSSAVHALLNWEAEAYRKSLAGQHANQ